MIMGEGKNPTQKHLLTLATTCNIKQEKALEIIHQVLSATQKWKHFAAEARVSAMQIKNIAENLDAISHST